MLANSASFNKLELEVNFGESALQFLPDNWECIGISTDSRDIKPHNLFVALIGENSDGHKYIEKALDAGASAALINTGWYKENEKFCTGKPVIIVKDTLIALGTLGKIHRRRFNCPVIAIAGANGKTTTKNMTANVLSQKYKVLSTYKNFNNRIGVPLMLLQLTQAHDIAVIEIGTNEPGEIAILSEIVEPTHGLITNIGKEHLEKLIDLDGVEMEETFLFGFLNKSNGFCFINYDDERLRKYETIFEDGIIYGTSGDKLMIKSEIELDDELHPIMNFEAGDRKFKANLITSGYTTGLNALAAATIGLHFGLTNEEIKNGLESYLPEAGLGYGRMLVEKFNGFTIINDCYNANPESMKAALNNLKSISANTKYAVLGDMRELGESSYEEHINILNYSLDKADFILLVGNEMLKAFNTIETNINVRHFASKLELTNYLKPLIKVADAVLVKGSRGMAMEEIINSLKQ